MLRHLAIVILNAKARFLSFVYGIALPVSYKRSWTLRGRPIIIKRRNSRITIGERFTACSHPKYNSLSVFQRVFIRTCTREAVITIGDDVGMSGCTVSASASISIGNRVLIGSGAMIMDSDAHPVDYLERRNGGKCVSRPVTIGDDVFIGARAIVLKGVTIGNGAVVGAGAVVVRDVPPFSVVAGNPAKVVNRTRNEEITCE